jgi:hypothetical protein
MSKLSTSSISSQTVTLVGKWQQWVRHAHALTHAETHTRIHTALDVLFKWGPVAVPAVLVLGGGAAVTRVLYERAHQRFSTNIVNQARRVIEDAHPFSPRSTQLPALGSLDRGMILQGEYRAGKTASIADTILTQWYPWWFQTICPPRGYFFRGNTAHATARDWLASQVSEDEKGNPISALEAMVNARHSQQWIRGLLVRSFPTYKLPSLLRPQPSLLIIDECEELIAKYRTDFLCLLEVFAKTSRDSPGTLQVIVITKTDAGTASLNAMNGGSLWTVEKCPTPTPESIEQVFGAADAKHIFRKLGGRVGLLHDFLRERHSNDEEPEQFLKRKDEGYIKVTKPVSEQEFHAASTA